MKNEREDGRRRDSNGTDGQKGRREYEAPHVTTRGRPITFFKRSVLSYYGAFKKTETVLNRKSGLRDPQDVC